MMRRFEIELRNEKARTYSNISLIVLILNFFVLLYVGIQGLTPNYIYPIGAAVIVGFIVAFEIYSRKKNPVNARLGLAFATIIIAWILSGFYLAAAANFILFLLQDIIRRKLVVLIFEDRLIYPSFPRKTLMWDELNNVVLRDGILTIDLKGDKLMQNEIMTVINESEFNEYCRGRLNAVKN